MVTDFLRDDVRGGEEVISFARSRFFADAHRQGADVIGEAESHGETEAGPGPALTAPGHLRQLVRPGSLAIELEMPVQTGLILGNWYPVKGIPGIHVSLMQPNAAGAEILKSHGDVVNRLDAVEAGSLVYLVAFDLANFELGFALGTEHPRVGWSGRVLDQVKEKNLPGPDGIGDIAPLIATGLVNPAYALRTVAAFTGGFKRAHGAFRYGALALHGHGSHYGFVENGVVFSRLQIGLSTLFVLDDGSIHMKTWSEPDNSILPRIKHARQNGVPIIEFDESTAISRPGRLVNRWGPGNWSGSTDSNLRTLRAGAALQENDRGRFLLYAVFTSATPSAMARVFQAYKCRYAMLLDMNALEHTYMAVYRREGFKLVVQHLLAGMNEVDMSESGQYVPRFLGFSDNRDFFYVMRRQR
jgi:hypothetical protein